MYILFYVNLFYFYFLSFWHNVCLIYINIFIYLHIFVYVSSHHNRYQPIMYTWFLITDFIINHLKLSIHLITIRIITDEIQFFFYQWKIFFMIQILYQKSRNTYSMVDIFNSVHQFNKVNMLTNII